MKQGDDAISPGAEVFRNFLKDRTAAVGAFLILSLLLIAVFAPFLANARPILVADGKTLSSPLLRSLFTTDSPEIFVEKTFNYLILFLPFLGLTFLLFKKRMRKILLLLGAVLLSIPFFISDFRLDKTDWRAKAGEIRTDGGTVLFAPVPYGPFETVAPPYQKPSAEHWFGVDHAGRDVLSRMIYGARVSSAVGIFATALAMAIGTLLGLFAGYKGGRIDLYVMRLVEIIICFPMFLLLLILMSIMLDYGSRQSILLVILVIGFSSWPGLCRLVRGETLKQRALPYMSAAEGLGVPLGSLLTRHLLPNVSGPIFVSFTFCVAEAILAESSLSFLGFGVQDPAASWGELLRQAFPDPVTYWHLTLWPGLAIFLAVCAFNFTGEGLRKAVNPR